MLVPLPDELEVGVVAVAPAAAAAAVIVVAVVEVAFAVSAVVAEVLAVAIAVVDGDIERSTPHVWASLRSSTDRDRSTVEATVLTVGMTVECNARLVNWSAWVDRSAFFGYSSCRYADVNQHREDVYFQIDSKQ